MDRAQPGARGSTNRNIEFDATYSGDSLAVTIALEEAFVDGWLVRDVTTDITLDADTDRQTIVIGWHPDPIYDDQQHDVRDEADRVMIALANDVVPMHPSIGIWEFDTDVAGVTAARDIRDIGPTLSRESVNSDTLHLPSILAANPDRF